MLDAFLSLQHTEVAPNGNSLQLINHKKFYGHQAENMAIPWPEKVPGQLWVITFI